MADIEKARELLRIILQTTGTSSSSHHAALAALRALDGDGAEEWHVSCRSDNPVGRYVDVHPYRKWIAIARDDAAARRIARLPALERAAQAVVDERDDGPMLGNRMPFERSIDALRAALNQEGQP